MQAGDPQTLLPELFNLPELSSAPQEVIEAVERFLSVPEEQAEAAVSSDHWTPHRDLPYSFSDQPLLFTVCIWMLACVFCRQMMQAHMIN